jgi:GNAT superfamily N-acetyltransferase
MGIWFMTADQNIDILSQVEIRNARMGESKSLSDLAYRSKGYWSYEKDLLDSYRSQLEVFEEEIAAGSVCVAVRDEQILGFYAISSIPNVHRLYFMFVEPKYIGQGVGKALWTHAIGVAKMRGWNSISFSADSFAAEKFYKKQGCKPIGQRESVLGPLIELTFDLN